MRFAIFIYEGVEPIDLAKCEWTAVKARFF